MHYLINICTNKLVSNVLHYNIISKKITLMLDLSSAKYNLTDDQTTKIQVIVSDQT